MFRRQLLCDEIGLTARTLRDLTHKLIGLKTEEVLLAGWTHILIHELFVQLILIHDAGILLVIVLDIYYQRYKGNRHSYKE